MLLQAIDFLSTNPSGGLRRERAGEVSHSETDEIEEENREPVVKQSWEFTHPSPEPLVTEGARQNTHNARFARLEFPCSSRGVCHGLAGYFEALLYAKEAKQVNGFRRPGGDTSDQYFLNSSVEGQSRSRDRVELSTNPITMDKKSKDMISWFPIFFPLKVGGRAHPRSREPLLGLISTIRRHYTFRTILNCTSASGAGQMRGKYGMNGSSRAIYA